MPSTVIRSFSYEPDGRRLMVEFVSGRRYAYFDVPAEVYEAMRESRARGAYFNKWVRDRYAFEQVAPV